MANITFTKDLEIGIAMIDEQHKELINRINNVSSTPNETQKTIDLLSEYVVKHFTDEQELHIKYNYPKAAEHKVLHQNFINEFDKIKKKFSGSEDAFKISLELIQFVVTWIIKHIKGVDIEFGRYYQENCLK
jgi:hemerythrin